MSIVSPSRHPASSGLRPEPIHASVDHHVARPIRRDRFPARDLFDAVEGGSSVRCQRGFDIVGPDAVENGQARPIRYRAELFRFGPGRDEEIAGPRLEQRRHRFARAKAIAIGLDRRAADRSGPIPEPAPVTLKRIAIEHEAKRAGHWPRPNWPVLSRRAPLPPLPNSRRRTGRRSARPARRASWR